MKDEDLETLLAKDAAQSFVELTKLNANHTTVRRRLYALEKIQKKGVSHQHLNELGNTCILLLARQKRKSFLCEITSGKKFIKKSKEIQDNLLLRHQSATFTSIRLIGLEGCALEPAQT